MPETVRVALVAVGGYGGHYLSALLDPPQEANARFVGAIDPTASERAPQAVQELRERRIPLYPSLDAFFAADSADLVVIASPHHLHCPQACQALAHGANVLCEKPVAATIQDARKMHDAARQAAKFAAIGYQWSYTTTIQQLKQDVLEGLFGRPIRLKTLCLWPRDAAYYARNDWAGHQRTPDGAWVLDSPANNATAHYLHNMLYVLGPTRETSARPTDLVAELYRANPITNFDTAALRIHTDIGAEILFYTTHAVSARIGPVASYQFEKATVYFDRQGSDAAARFVARFRDGSLKTYDPPAGQDLRKLWHCVDACRTGAPVACGVEAATPHLLCVNGAQDSMPDIAQFPPPLIRAEGEAGQRRLAVRGLEDAFFQCCDQCILPSEHGDLAWAKPGEPIDLTGYDSFPSHRHAHPD